MTLPRSKLEIRKLRGESTFSMKPRFGQIMLKFVLVREKF